MIEHGKYFITSGPGLTLFANPSVLFFLLILSKKINLKVLDRYGMELMCLNGKYGI